VAAIPQAEPVSRTATDGVEIRGLDHLRTANSSGQDVLLTPNHSGHADAYIMYDVADKLGKPFYFMTAWQFFQQQSTLGQWMLQHHGCFSIDREGTDLKAFRQATEILEQGRSPLVIFPEGEVYHINVSHHFEKGQQQLSRPLDEPSTQSSACPVESNTSISKTPSTAF